MTTKDHKCPALKNDPISAKYCDIAQHSSFCADKCKHNEHRIESKYQIAKANFDK